MGFVAAGIGAAGAIGGAIISGNAQEDAANAAARAAQFSPFAIQTGLGGTGVETTPGFAGGRLTSALSPQLGVAQSSLAGQFAGLTTQTGPEQRAIEGALGAQERMGLRLGSRGIMGVQGAFGDLEGQFAGAGGRDEAALAELRSGLGRAAGGVGRGADVAFDQAQGLLGRDFGQVREDELGLLRAQARPAEERAVNAKFQNLFSTGRLGTTGGIRGLGELARVQEQADIGRQLAATQTAQGLRGQNLAAGSGFLGLSQQGDIAQAGIRSDAARGLFGAETGLTERGLSRGQQRLSAAEGLFGFGTEASGVGLDRAERTLGSALTLDDANRANLALSINAGSGQAAAGGNVANAILAGGGSNVGSFFQSAGAGLLEGGLDRILNPSS